MDITCNQVIPIYNLYRRYAAIETKTRQDVIRKIKWCKTDRYKNVNITQLVKKSVKNERFDGEIF